MRFCLFFLSCLFFISCLNAQEKSKIELISAQELLFNVDINPDVQRLTGRVVFKHNESFMYCDSAYLYLNRNSLEAFGNVQIRASDTMNLFGEHLIYDGDKRIAIMDRKVQLIDNQVTLTTDKLTYDMNKREAYYLTGGKIEDPDNTLTSKQGYYHAATKEFFFHEDVVVNGNNSKMLSDSLMYNTQTGLVRFYGPTRIESDSSTILCSYGWYDTKKDITYLQNEATLYNGSSMLKGDTLYYDKKLGIGKANHDVFFRDTTENVIIYGDYGEFYEVDSSVWVTDSALMVAWDESDSIYVHGDTLFSGIDSASQGRVMKVYRGVSFFRSDMQGICDSLAYSLNDSIMRMYYNPVLWSDSSQMSAAYAEFRIDRGGIKGLFLQGDAMIISKYREGDYNQIKGKEIRGFFVEGELVKLIVDGNAETIYFIEDENGSLTGIDYSMASSIIIWMGDGEVKTISMLDKPQGTIYPENEFLGSSRFLEGFLWIEDSRPSSPQSVMLNNLVSTSSDDSANERLRNKTEN